MPIQFVGATVSDSTPSEHIQIPAVQEGDLILIHSMRYTSSLTLGTPTGFTLLYALNAASQVFYKFADAAAAAQPSPKITYAERHACVVYRGVNESTPFGDAQYFPRAFRNNLTINAVLESTPPVGEFVFLMASKPSSTLLTNADMSSFTFRAQDSGCAVYSAPGPTFPGAYLVLTGGNSYMSTQSFIGLIPAPERQRCPLLLTPW